MTSTTPTPLPPVVETTAGYDLWANSYDAFENPMIAMVGRALDVRPLTVRGLRVVELGCGTGRNLRRMLEEGAAAYTGVDASAGMLAVARGKASADARVTWVEADLRTPLPLASGVYDLVLFTLVLEHFPEVGPVLREARRLLAPGGRLRLLEIHPSLVDRGTGAHFWHEGRELKLASHPHTAAEYRDALTSAGLVPTVVSEWFPPEAMIRQLPKLGKHQGQPMLLDVEAATKGALDGPA